MAKAAEYFMILVATMLIVTVIALSSDKPRTIAVMIAVVVIRIAVDKLRARIKASK